MTWQLHLKYKMSDLIPMGSIQLIGSGLEPDADELNLIIL
jgi:hypothetical protein